MIKNSHSKRLPEWLRKNRMVPVNDPVYQQCVTKKLNTVCVSARCPNISECFSKKHATFLLLGSMCTRHCRFCNIDSADSFSAPDMNEPGNVAKAIDELGIKYAVLTSVTRDDLTDGGSEHWAHVIKTIKSRCPDVKVEALIPDFGGNEKCLTRIIESGADCIAHNMETISRLYTKLRPEADYRQSLDVLRYLKIHKAPLVKTGFMVGLGETEEEIHRLMIDLAKICVDSITIGQYLMPSSAHYPVAEYVRPETFKKYKKIAFSLGIRYVESAPFVRSSYNAGKWTEGGCCG